MLKEVIKAVTRRREDKKDGTSDSAEKHPSESIFA